MKTQPSLSGRRLRRAFFGGVSAATLYVTALMAQSSSSSPGSTSSTMPSADTNGSSTNTRTGNDRTRTGSGSQPTSTSNTIPGATSSSPDLGVPNTSSSSSGNLRSGTLASGSTDNNSSLVRADRRFVTKAAELNTEEVRLSELAAQQASNPEVRAFAQQLVTAHTQASSELNGIAGRKGLDAMARDDYDQRAVTKLSKKSGTDFDKAYLEKMVDAHDDAVDLFQKASRDAKDPELQAFASKMLPDLQQHQQHAKSLEQTVSRGSSSSSRTMGSGGSSSSDATSGSSSGAGSSGGLTR